MKLVNLNIWIKINNSKLVATFLDSEKPDIICLQEVSRHLDKNVFEAYRSQEIIKGIIWKDYWYSFFGSLWVSEYFMKNNKKYRDFWWRIEQWNEIISKFPIITAENKFYYREYFLFNNTTNWEKTDHGRALQKIELIANGKKLQILIIHWIWTRNKLGDERTIAQCKYIVEIARQNDIATIIVGDFNLLPESDSIKIINKEFINLLKINNIKSTRPDFNDNVDIWNNVVDYVFVNDKIKINNFTVIETNISDHFPLILDFDILN